MTTGSSAARGTAAAFAHILLAVGLVTAFSFPTAAAKTRLTVYTAFYVELLPAFKERFETRHPDIEITWLRLASGLITARVLAERERTEADVVWGVASTSLMQIAAAGLAEPYAPAGLDNIARQFRDKADPPHWVGMDAWIAAVCFNTEIAAQHNLPRPESWLDLTKPVYRGRIAMPDPTASGTGFLHVSSWLQLFGEEAGWQFMDALHPNIAQYTQSGSKPCRMAAAGEAAIGVSFAFRGAKLKKKGAPIDLIYPREGLGWDMDAFLIVKTTKNMEAAKRLADWSVTREANELYAESFAVVAMPGAAKPIPHYAPDITQRLIENDFVWAATNRSRILAEWLKRYAPK